MQHHDFSMRSALPVGSEDDRNVFLLWLRRSKEIWQVGELLKAHRVQRNVSPAQSTFSCHLYDLVRQAPGMGVCPVF